MKDHYVLANGVKIPSVGFGTWQAPDGDVAVDAVKAAIASGYRHIDTAQAYGNEASVGKAVAECGVPREELFITTKLTNDNHSYDLVMSSFEESLADLGLDYVDMFLIHWPSPKPIRDHWEEANAETWRAMEELYDQGKIRALGVSNFMPHHIRALLKTCRVKPVVDQIRLCPGDAQDEVVSYLRSEGILAEAYSPLGTGKIFDVPEIKALSEKYGKSVARICIRWSLQMGFLPLPKSVTPSRIEENLKVFDFELDEDDMALIASLKGCAGTAPDPDNMPW